MKSTILLIGLSLSASLASAQHAGYNPPVVQHQNDAARPSTQAEFEVAKSQYGQNPSSAVQQMQAADLAKLKQDADELAGLAQSIPPDVDQTTKGTLPKDLDEKLKRIEKLAKQLRSRISH